jgi:hypothetical protein
MLTIRVCNYYIIRDKVITDYTHSVYFRFVALNLKD